MPATTAIKYKDQILDVFITRVGENHRFWSYIGLEFWEVGCVPHLFSLGVPLGEKL